MSYQPDLAVRLAEWMRDMANVSLRASRSRSLVGESAILDWLRREFGETRVTRDHARALMQLAATCVTPPEVNRGVADALMSLRNDVLREGGVTDDPTTPGSPRP